ncbi:MAG: hypothetical protein K2N70_05250 [Helicobacter sp.]|nr:hypothetical protein [Helicobacter sp.]
MAKNESLQEELNLLRSMFLTCLAAVFGIYGYFTINYDKLTQMTIVLGAIGIFVLFITMILCMKKWINSKIKLERE